jgi:hypothetical protein
VEASERVEAAAREVADAGHELDLFVNNPRLLSVLGEEKLQKQTALADEIVDGDLLRAWPTLTISEKRRLMNGLLNRIVVTRADGRGRHASPVRERTQIVRRGGTPLTAPDDLLDVS